MTLRKKQALNSTNKKHHSFELIKQNKTKNTRANDLRLSVEQKNAENEICQLKGMSNWKAYIWDKRLTHQHIQSNDSIVT